MHMDVWKELKRLLITINPIRIENAVLYVVLVSAMSEEQKQLQLQKQKKQLKYQMEDVTIPNIITDCCQKRNVRSLQKKRVKDL